MVRGAAGAGRSGATSTPKKAAACLAVLCAASVRLEDFRASRAMAASA